MKNNVHTRKRPPYTPHLDTCRTTTEKFLNELAADGVGNGYEPGDRSAHWWVGCLASQLEYFLAATNPERAEPQQDIS